MIFIKAILYSDKEDIRYEEIKAPDITKPDDVIIKVHYAGICGSEVARIIGDMPIPQEKPTAHGHEFAGVVTKIGSAVTSVKPGDRVSVAPRTVCGVCDNCLNDRVGQCVNTRGFIGVKLPGGWAEYCMVDEINVVKLPEGLSTCKGAFLEPLTVAVHGIWAGNFRRGLSTAVLGVGTIGLLTLQAAKSMGAELLTAFDIDEGKLELAKKFGAEYTVNTKGGYAESALKITGGRYFQYVLETGGVPFTEKAGIEITGAQGTLVYIGTPFSEIRFEPRLFEQINRKEMWIKGSWQSYSTPFPGKEWPFAAKLLQSGEVKLDGMIDRVVPMEEIFNVMDDYRRGKVRGKVLMKIASDADEMDIAN